MTGESDNSGPRAAEIRTPAALMTASRAGPATQSPIAPLLLWVVMQLFALVVGAMNIPLSARPLPTQQLAIHELIVVQLGAAALLFPFLLRDGLTAMLVIGAGVAFTFLAGYVSVTPLAQTMPAAAYVACVLAGLTGWRAVLSGARRQMLGVAAAAAVSLGGGVLWYLHAEASSASVDWSRAAFFGPIPGAIAQIESPSPLLSWITPLVLGLAPLLFQAVGRQKAVPS